MAWTHLSKWKEMEAITFSGNHSEAGKLSNAGPFHGETEDDFCRIFYSREPKPVGPHASVRPR